MFAKRGPEKNKGAFIRSRENGFRVIFWGIGGSKEMLKIGGRGLSAVAVLESRSEAVALRHPKNLRH